MINANNAMVINPGNNFLVGNRQGSQRSSASRGDILTAVVTDINNGIYSLQTKDGMKFSADSSVVSGNIGDELSFEVLEGRMENGKSTLVLKQLPQKQGAFLRDMARAKSSRELFRSNGYLTEGDAPMGDQDQQLDRLRAIASIKRRILQGRCAGPQITGTLSAMGLSVNKISFAMLSGIMNDLGIHNARKVADANARQAIQNYTQGDQAMFGNQQDVLEALSRHGVPLTNGNIQTIIDAIERFDASNDITTQAKVYLLKEGLDVNVANIFAAKGVSVGASEADISPADLDGMSSAIEEFFAINNIDNTPDNKDLARFMIRHSIDINSNNIHKLSFLNNMSGAERRAQVLDQLALAMSIGKDPLSAQLDSLLPSPEAHELMEYYTELIDNYPDVSHISDDNLGTALAIANGRKSKTTLQTVRHVVSGFVRGAYNLLEDLPANDDSKRYLATTRITLEEIRLKLSFEAAQLLASKGIDIDTMPLLDALEKVNLARREALEGSFNALAHTPDEHALTLLERTNDAVRNLQPLGLTTLGWLVTAPKPSINSILASVNAERAGAGYQDFMTMVNPKLGDSFAKVRSQFAPFLESIGIKPTAPNMFAAEILSKNNIDVTPENVSKIKLIDREVSFVAERLHPVIAASIIRDGLNPLEMHVREVISYINGFNDAYGVSDADQIASYIALMDRQNQYSDSEREKIIAFYRVLNQVTKNGSAALGTIYKQGVEPTLGNMLSAADYFRQSHGGGHNVIDQTTDAGLLENVVNGSETIRGILAKKQEPDADLASFIARELVPQLTPNNMSDLLHKAESSPHTTLEEALQELSLNKYAQTDADQAPGAAEPSKAYADAMAEAQVAQIFDTPPKAIHWLESRGITATPGTMTAVSALMSDQFYIGKELNKAHKRLTETIKQAETKPQTRKLEESLNNLEIDNIAQYSPKDLQDALEPFDDFKILRSAIKVKSAASNLQGGSDYTYPVKLHDGIANLNMYVLNARNLATSTQARAVLALNTGNLGNVFAGVQVEDTRLTLEVSCEDPAAVAALESRAEGLSQALASAGFADYEVTLSFTQKPQQEDTYPNLEDQMTPRINLPGYSSPGWKV